MNGFVLAVVTNLFLLSVPSYGLDSILTADGQRLSAKWEVPVGEVQGVALILPGSGNVGMDGDVSGPFIGNGFHGEPAKLSDQIANALVLKGIASLRYSKRGVEDPAQIPNQKFPYLQQDAQSALQALRARFPGKPLSLVGLSEGALIATLLSNENQVDGLFLLSPPLRRMDQIIGYQFLGWPLAFANSKLSEGDGFISFQSWSLRGQFFKLPLYDVANLFGFDLSFQALDSDGDQSISIADELVPVYQKLYQTANSVLQSPALKGWYDSYLALPDLTQVMSNVRAKNLFVYVGMEDPQVKWTWIMEDSHYFSVAPQVRLYSGLGHCFAPMEGVFGTIKSSGPIDSKVLTELAQDIAKIH